MVKSKRSAQIRKAFNDILARRAARAVPEEKPVDEKPVEETPDEEVPPPPPNKAPPLLRVPSAEEGWGPKKGELLEVKTPEGEWVTAVVIKEPLHRRWFHVYSPEFGRVYKRMTLDNLRATIYSIEGSQLTIGKAFQDQVVWVPKKGEEVLVHPENPDGGEPAVATITKVPFHRRWYHLYQQETKQRMRRVPASRLTKYNAETFPEETQSASVPKSSEAEAEPEAEPAAEPPAAAADTKAASLIKGDIVYALIDGVKERVAVLNLPGDEDVASVYILSSPSNESRMHRVPLSAIIGPVDEPKEDDEPKETPAAAPAEPATLDLKRGDYVEAHIDGLWTIVVVTKVPKHKRWFHVRTMTNFDEEARLYKRIPVKRIRKFENPDDAPANSIASLRVGTNSPASSSGTAITSIVLDSMLKSLREKEINPARITQSYLRETFPQYASMINKSVWNVILSEISPTRL